MPDEAERLQKVMAQAGGASRRAGEAMILSGRVSVNGLVITELGTRVRAGIDRITVDGADLPVAKVPVYGALYKPVGYVSSNRDPHATLLASDLVPAIVRVYPVGRLDRDSEGLMLYTNDGPLALRLTHPRYGHEKEYRVSIRGTLTQEARRQLASGVSLQDKALPARAHVRDLPAGWLWRGEPVPSGCQWIGLVLREGHKREIRELMAHLGLSVQRLIRVRIASLELGELQTGQYRPLSESEVSALRRITGLSDGDRKESHGLGTHNDSD